MPRALTLRAKRNAANQWCVSTKRLAAAVLKTFKLINGNKRHTASTRRRYVTIPSEPSTSPCKNQAEGEALVEVMAPAGGATRTPTTEEATSTDASR